jgi:hypothetical protein
MAKVSLLKRAQGPRGVPIALLVERGDKAADSVCARFGDYLEDGIAKVADAAAVFLKARDDVNLDAFVQAIRDVRSSSATAGHAWAAVYARSLEIAVQSREITDQNLPVIVTLHIDALNVAARGTSPTAELQQLEESLGRVQSALR